MVPVRIVSLLIGIRTEDGAESLLLSMCEVAIGSTLISWWKMLGSLTGRVGMLIVVALTLRRECETTGFVDIEEMALKFGKWWQSFVI